MFCIVSFIVLSILGIFSASNRQMAKEAFSCVGRRLTFRPCNTGFDEKMKAKILGVVITRSEKAAKWLNKWFEAISWFFFVLMLASLIAFFAGLYLWFTTGSCNGVNSASFCIYDPSGSANQISTSPECGVTPTTIKDLSLENVDLSLFPTLNPGGEDRIVMIGCYSCEYTHKAYPLMMRLLERFPETSFTFLHFPVKEANDYLSQVSYCVNKLEPDKFWDFNQRMFSSDIPDLSDAAYIQQLLSDTGINTTRVNACTSDPFTEWNVQTLKGEVTRTKFYGTPTVFINDADALVGPKPYRVYAIALKGFFYWLVK